MKKVSVLILIAIIGVAGWVLPAGAQKIRLTDDQLDEIMAGAKNKGSVSSSITGDNAGGTGAFFGQPAGPVDPATGKLASPFCTTIPSGKCPTPTVTQGNAAASSPVGDNNAISMTGSAAASTNTAVLMNNASAPPVSTSGAAAFPPGFNSKTNAGGNTVQIIQVKF